MYSIKLFNQIKLIIYRLKINRLSVYREERRADNGSIIYKVFPGVGKSGDSNAFE